MGGAGGLLLDLLLFCGVVGRFAFAIPASFKGFGSALAFGGGVVFRPL